MNFVGARDHIHIECCTRMARKKQGIVIVSGDVEIENNKKKR
jgi:hypothetical protein